MVHNQSPSVDSGEPSSYAPKLHIDLRGIPSFLLLCNLAFYSLQTVPFIDTGLIFRAKDARLPRGKKDKIAWQKRILLAPKPRWTVLTHRRLQTYPSALVKDTLIASPLPRFLTDPIIPRLLSIPRSANDDGVNIFSGSPHGEPNHCLVNEYLPGQGIMPHKDGSSYWPVVCTVSLGASLCLDVYQSNEDGSVDRDSRQRILQEPRSLLVTTDELYTECFHGISDVIQDVNLNEETLANWSLLGNPDAFENGINERDNRVSLTFRDVVKVSKLGNKFAVFGKR